METTPDIDQYIEEPIVELEENNLQVEGWRDARRLLNLYAEIIGKIRLSLHPKLNYWWHTSLSISSVGWTTGPIPYNDGSFEIELNFIDHILWIRKSDGLGQHLSLYHPSIKSFHDTIFSSLKLLGIEVSILENPFDEVKVKSNIPFNEDNRPISYNPDFAYRFWKAQLEADMTFQIFKGRFLGSSSPIQLFWHHFDLELTFFSGRTITPTAVMNKVSKEAYSQKVISFGFRGGDDNIDEPAYYAYIDPELQGLIDVPLKPIEAFWNHQESGTLAILTLHDLLNSPDPRQTVLDFMESVFSGGSKLSNWDKSLSELRPVIPSLH